MAEFKHLFPKQINTIYKRDHKINFMGVCWCDPLKKIAKNGDVVFAHKD